MSVKGKKETIERLRSALKQNGIDLMLGSKHCDDNLKKNTKCKGCIHSDPCGLTLGMLQVVDFSEKIDSMPNIPKSEKKLNFKFTKFLIQKLIDSYKRNGCKLDKRCTSDSFVLNCIAEFSNKQGGKQ